MKRIIAIAMVFLFLFSSTANAACISETGNNRNEEYTIVGTKEGVYTTLKTGLKNGIKITQYMNFEDIYASGEGKYYQMIDCTKFIPVNKISIGLLDEKLEATMLQYGMKAEIINDIKSKAESCVKRNNKDAEVVFFVDPSTGKGTWSTSVWGGKTFHNYFVNITNYWTEYKTLISGSGTSYSTLNNLYNFTISVLGIFSTPISVFGAGISALAFFGLPVDYNHPDNYIQAALGGNWGMRYTYYYYLGADILCTLTHHIDFFSIDTVEFFISNDVGHRKNNVSSFPQSVNSTYYSNAEANAYSMYLNGLAPYYDSVSVKVEAASYHKYYYFQ